MMFIAGLRIIHKFEAKHVIDNKIEKIMDPTCEHKSVVVI